MLVLPLTLSAWQDASLVSFFLRLLVVYKPTDDVVDHGDGRPTPLARVSEASTGLFRRES